MEAFGRLIAVITAVLLLLMLPVLMLWSKDQDRKLDYVKETTEAFTEEIRKTGAITLEEYEAFTYKVGLTGRLYNIEIMAAVQMQGSEEDEATKAVDSFLSAAYTEEILETLYTTGVYRMSRSAYITVRVKEKENDGSYAAVYTSGGKLMAD